MTEIPEHLVAAWWDTLARHSVSDDGRCVVCGVLWCRTRAEVYAALVALDLYFDGPPDQATATDRGVACRP